MIKKISSVVMAMVLLTTMFQWHEAIAEDVLTADVTDYFFKVLEISPEQDKFDLKQSDFKSDNVKLYQYSIEEYNAIREDMVGKYDIIYIGNANTKDTKYYTLGDPVSKIPSGNYANDSIINQISTTVPIYEYWPGNDATELILGYLEDLLDAGQLIFADSKFEADFDPSKDKESRLYSFIQANESRINFVDVKNVSKEIPEYTYYDAYTAIATPRPYLNVTSAPVQFDSTDESTYIDTSLNSEVSSIDFTFDALGYEGTTFFDVNLYFDLDGDNKYKASENELIKSRTDIASDEQLTMSLVVPDNFKGLQPYKLEIIDQTTGAINYTTGYMGFRGDDPIEALVLQIAPNGSTFNLASDLISGGGADLLKDFSDDYVIDVDVITVDQYKNLYNDADFELTEYIGPGRSKPYNMIIYGFADTYGGADISNERMANDLKNFINTGQSVMFTHDTVTFRLEYSGGWGRNITRYFREFVGQNIYSDGEYPLADKITIGFSDMAFQRAATNNFRTTTSVYAFNEGIMTRYPFTLNGGEDELYDYGYGSRTMNVANTHYQYYQLDLNDEEVVVWYTLAGTDARINYRDPANYYYTYSKGNVTYSGTGHSNLNAASSYAERELFVNTIIKALRGANFAPEITIQGVNSGDDVARTATSLSFSILVEDPDINDQYMDGVLYLDKNGDGNFTDDEIVATYDADDHTDGENAALENGVPKSVVLDLTELDAGISEFAFKVVATDTEGASGSKKSEHPLVDLPVITLQMDAPGGMLLGDEASITTEAYLTNPELSLETSIYDMTVLSGLYDKDDITVAYDVSDTTDYQVTGYSTDYSVLGDVLRTLPEDISNPSKGIVDQSIDKWSYDFKAISAGDYYLSSSIHYNLAYYGLAETIETGQLFEARRGKITYNFSDDLGGTLDQEVEGTLYRFDTADDVGDMDDPDFDNGTPVKDFETVGSKAVLGDDPDEILETGYYAVKTDEKDNYLGSSSKAIYLDYVNPNQQVDVEVTASQIYGFKWIHEDAPDVPGVMKVLDNTESSVSEIRFTTLREMNSIHFEYDDSLAAGVMSMVLSKIIYTDAEGNETEVTSSFTHNTSGNTFDWTDSEKAKIGDYRFVFTHQFYSGASAGSQAYYELMPDITVNLDDASGTPVDRTYTFTDLKLLSFLKALDLL